MRIKLQTEIEADFSKRKDKIESEINLAKVKHQELLSHLDQEYKKSKALQDANLAELKQVELSNIKDLRKKAEEEIVETRQKKAKAVSSKIYALLAGEMYKSRNKVLDETFIESFSKDFQEMVVDLMLDRDSAGSDKLHQILKTSANAKGKERLYWKKMGTIAATLVGIIFILWLFPGLIIYPTGLLEKAFSKKDTAQADAYVTKRIEEAKKQINFTPPTTPEYKLSYVDNVIYTTSFEEKRMNQAFQDKWILELNDFFINRLDVKDTTIIKFVSLETALMRDLVKLRNQIDPEQTSIKIDEMKAREEEFKTKLAEIFNDINKVSVFYEFSENFWNDFYNPRVPPTTKK